MARTHYSGRQEQILALAARGSSDKEIAAALGVSPHTIRTHLQRLYRDHGVTNRAAAVAAWMEGQGGGDDARTEPLPSAAAPAVMAPPLPSPAQLPMQTVPAFAQAVLINGARTAAEIGPLDWSEELATIA